jgi:hypothetical protein
MQDQQFPISRRESFQRVAAGALGLSAIFSTAGCSQILLSTGKILFGDPKVPAEFTNLTKEDLTRGTKTVLVACSAPESVEADYSTLKLDVIDGVTRRLKLHSVRIINPDRVADWIDEHGGLGSDVQELAQDFEADYIAWIDVQSFELREPNSPKLLRGHTTGYIRVFKVEEENTHRRALKVYQTEFSMTYPQHQPISEQGRSAIVFHKEYITRLCDMLSERFYNHRPGANF